MAALGFTFDATSVAPRAVESAVRRYFGGATMQDDNDDELQVALKAEAENLAISLLGARRLDAPAALTGRPPTRLTCW
jgi:hypothetical protein